MERREFGVGLVGHEQRKETGAQIHGKAFDDRTEVGREEIRVSEIHVSEIASNEITGKEITGKEIGRKEIAGKEIDREEVDVGSNDARKIGGWESDSSIERTQGSRKTFDC